MIIGLITIFVLSSIGYIYHNAWKQRKISIEKEREEIPDPELSKIEEQVIGDEKEAEFEIVVYQDTAIKMSPEQAWYWSTLDRAKRRKAYRRMLDGKEAFPELVEAEKKLVEKNKAKK